jgi:hypothetical protein
MDTNKTFKIAESSNDIFKIEGINSNIDLIRHLKNLNQEEKNLNSDNDIQLLS